MFPKSRFPEYAEKDWNIKRCTWKEHEAWHILFGNMTPQEAVMHILLNWTPANLRREIIEAIITLLTIRGE
jgi:hypothetical protein